MACRCRLGRSPTASSMGETRKERCIRPAVRTAALIRCTWSSPPRSASSPSVSAWSPRSDEEARTSAGPGWRRRAAGTATYQEAESGVQRLLIVSSGTFPIVGNSLISEVSARKSDVLLLGRQQGAGREERQLFFRARPGADCELAVGMVFAKAITRSILLAAPGLVTQRVWGKDPRRPPWERQG
jgi:hypothetical protein